MRAPNPPTDDARTAHEPRVIGVAFRTVDHCFREHWGTQAHSRAAALMLEPVARTYHHGLFEQATWYPISWYRDVFRAYRTATGSGPELARRIGSMAVQHDMKGAHKRLVAWLASPQLLLTLTQLFFNTYYDTGRIETVTSRRGFAHIRAVGCVGWDLNMWSELAGSSASMLGLAGARDVRVYGTAGGRDGDEHHELEAHWSA